MIRLNKMLGVSKWPGLLLAVLLAGACASGPGIPDSTYFRLPPAPALTGVGESAISVPIEIDTFLADGVHSDQAVLYSLDPDSERLRAYHYQLWVDPPTRMLQRRLLKMLSEARIAPLVAERLEPDATQLRVQGRIEAFERVRRADGWHVQVALQMRVDTNAERLPLLVRDYRQERLAKGSGVLESVRALGEAVDAVFAEFARDLQAVARQ